MTTGEFLLAGSILTQTWKSYVQLSFLDTLSCYHKAGKDQKAIRY